MKLNSYGWVFLFIILMAVMAWIGGEQGFSTYEPALLAQEVTFNEVSGIPTYHGALSFIANMAIGNIEGMPLVFTIVLYFIPLMAGWIVYRQIRGQD